MEYKQLSPTLVIRSPDGVRVAVDDPDFVAWVGAGNCPFPPDSPSQEEIEKMETE